MLDLDQRLAALSENEKDRLLTELITALHDENTDQAYKTLRAWDLEQSNLSQLFYVESIPITAEVRKVLDAEIEEGEEHDYTPTLGTAVTMFNNLTIDDLMEITESQDVTILDVRKALEHLKRKLGEDYEISYDKVV